MIVRPMDDLDWLRVPSFQKEYKFEWKFPENSSRIAAACAVDDFALCVAELTPEITLAMRQDLHPHLRLRGLAMIHEYMKTALHGYPQAFCHVPPELERGYGRHLQRIFGWQELWKGYRIKGESQ